MVKDNRTPSTTVVPDLAYAWEVSDDLTTYTYHLREGVKFHNGSELTSADVKASIIRAIAPESYQEGLVSPIGVTLAQGGLTPAGISTPDDYTVVASIPSADVRPLDWMMHAWSSQYLKIADDAWLAEVNGRKHDASPVDGGNTGSGPFIFKEITDDVGVTEANPNYWNPNVPYLDGVEFIWGKNTSPQLTASLLTGQIDWAWAVAPAEANDPNSPLATTPGINSVTHLLPDASGVAFNNESGPLSDKRVRKAIALSIDMHAVRKAVKPYSDLDLDGGWWPSADGTFSLSKAQLLTEKYFRSPTPEDIAEAKQLLADAGYASGADVPTLTLITFDGPKGITLVETYQAMLKENLGIDSQIEVDEMGIYHQRYRDREFDIGAEMYIPMHNPYPEEWIKGAVGQCDGKPCNFNRGGANIPGADDVIAELAGTAGDPDRRMEVSKELYDLLVENMPHVPLSTSAVLHIRYWDHLKGYQSDGVTISSPYLGAKWDYVWLDR